MKRVRSVKDSGSKTCTVAVPSAATRVRWPAADRAGRAVGGVAGQVLVGAQRPVDGAAAERVARGARGLARGGAGGARVGRGGGGAGERDEQRGGGHDEGPGGGG